MDRTKLNSSNRPQKKITEHHGSEFYALGKTNRDDQKIKISSMKNTNANTMERKRDSTSTLANVAKKAKISSRHSPDIDTSKDLGESDSRTSAYFEKDGEELVELITSSLDSKDTDSIMRILQSCIKNLANTSGRVKYDPVLYLLLMYISKICPHYFNRDNMLVQILRRETNAKTRQNIYALIGTCNILVKCHNEEWPDVFLRLYIDDAINERFWCDNALCSIFVANILYSFKTTQPQNNAFVMNECMQSQYRGIYVEDVDTIYTIKEATKLITNENIRNNILTRYSDINVERIVTDCIKEQLTKRQQQDCYTRNFLKFLCTTAGLSEVRLLCTSRLELWIHNGKLVKIAQQLLSYICANLNNKCIKDQEVLTVLLKMRFKTKPLINFYMTCFKDIISFKSDLLHIILKFVVQNELSNTRNPNNMGMLAAMFQLSPEKSASNLAEIYKEFLLQKEDCLRTLRVFFRELVRMLRFDINITLFCKVFLNGRSSLNKQIEVCEYKERIFYSMVDIVCLCMLISVSPQVREACISLRTNRDNKINPVLMKFYSQMSEMQLDAISWMYETVPNLFKISSVDYNQSLHKILLLECPEQYSRCDQWPSEAERTTLLRIVSETPIHQETLLRIILIGITKDIPFTIPDTIDILMLVIKRVSSMRPVDYPAINVNKFDIIDFLFSMTEYHHPENIKLPDDYDPPKLAITVLYWKAWIIMLMISAHNPSTFGSFCWDHYPTMKSLIEMCITNQFNDVLISKDELQIISVERNHILEFESYLAAQTSQAIITEDNAILISQLMLMDPMGPARKVPPIFLEQLKTMNKSLKLGLLLCRSRKPDLLLDIIERQGTTQSMPWLSDLVQSSEGEFNNLPVQCLCEFLMFNSNIINEDNNRDAELVNFLRDIVSQPDSNSQTVCEMLDYIFRRLSSANEYTRVAAIEGMKLIFKIPKDEEIDNILKLIPHNPHFSHMKSFVIPHIRAACQVENSPKIVMSYIQFIATHTVYDSVAHMLDHVIDMSQLIVERSTLFQHIIPTKQCDNYDNQIQTLKCLFVMFNNYIIKLREIHDSYEWTEYPDLLMVQFNDGIQLPLHLNIIHAFIILLSLAAHYMPEAKPILDYWFPLGTISPRAYLLNSVNEQMQLLPDWLKLKMIRSSVDQLTEAALHELMPDQIVLFVQNFGTPVKSMSKLLARLDLAVIEQCDSVRNAILNKNYLAQLIEIQRKRGAKNGHFTMNALQLGYHASYINNTAKRFSNIYETLTIPISAFKTNDKHMKDRTNYLEIISSIFHLKLQSNKYDTLQCRQCFNELINKSKSINITTIEKKIIDSLEELHNFLNTSIIKSLPIGYTSQAIQLCTLFRILNRRVNYTFSFNGPLKMENKTSFESKSNELMCCHRSLQIMHMNNITKHNNAQKSKKENFDIDKMWVTVSKYLKEYPCSTFHPNAYEDKLNCKGLLVDSFTEIDPEFILASSKKLQIEMLFSLKFTNFRFFLLSLVCHQTNWKSLISTITDLFKQNDSQDLDYNTVLNFLEAFICNPKLWQGSDKSISNSYQKEFGFLIKSNEVEVLAHFIIKECLLEMDKPNANQYDYKLFSRINLLLILIRKRFQNVGKIADCVLKHSSPINLKYKVYHQIYLMYPSIKFIKYAEREKATELQNLKGCQADKVSNCLITCLGNLVHKKDFETLSTDSELLIRKLASSHPALFLRQLGLLISVIQERAKFNFRNLRDGYSLQKCLQILRILELLQPMLFEDAYIHDFRNCVEYFFCFLKSYAYAKDIYPILIKFVELLQKYININPSSSKKFLERYVSTLMDLSFKFRSVTSLQNLLQRIALLQHSDISSKLLKKNDLKLEIYLETQTELKAENAITLEDESTDCNNSGYIPNTRKSFMISPHYLNLINIIKHSNCEDTILSPLQEIESLTSKRFSFLNELFDRLLELIFSQSAQIRSNAFILLIRHLKHNPGCSYINQCTLNSYIKCLRSDNSSVASTAVDNLTEITILLHEYVVEILTVAFSLGIKSHLNTSSQIKRILQTLSLEQGC